jgi:membrane protein implicated in regulation of membrane protease activity
METNYWWAWMVLAAVFIIGEILTAGFFLMCFGVGAIVAGLLALLGANMIWQLMIFIVVSLILFLVSRKFADRVSKEQPPGIGADRFVGKICIVLEQIDNHKNTGRVRMDREEWRTESDGDEVIPAGSKVVVTRLDGSHLVVRKIQEGE